MIRQTLPIALLIATTALAQPASPAPKKSLRELTLENIYDPKKQVAFAGAPQSGFVWLDDKTIVWPRTDEKRKVVEQVVLDLETGKRRPLFDAAKLEAAAKKLTGVSEEEARDLPLQKAWTFSPDNRTTVVALSGDLYLYDLTSDSLTRLTEVTGEEQEASFSPDGKVVGFVRNNNIYVVDLATRRERQLTIDGNDDTLNGILDWVYQEEIYGRGTFKAYWWSPDSSRIAYIRLDERKVPRFTVVDHIPYGQTLELTPYPKPGDPNPIASLLTVPVGGGTPSTINTQKYDADEPLIVNVDWLPDSSAVVFQIQNREQTWLDVVRASVDASAPRLLFRETTKAWVERQENPVWLKDGSFLWLSERSGFNHIYHYAADGTLRRQVTNGQWEARTIHGVDASEQWIFFSGTERSVLGTDVYRVRIDGSGLQRLSDAAGQHMAVFNPSMTMYVETWTTLQRPARVAAYRADGALARVVDENESAALTQYTFARPEFVQVRARDGFVMEAIVIRPPDFNAAKKHPVYQHTYAGPHSQQVRNSWRGSEFLWWQFLASKGIVVFVLDNRTASGKGAQSAWPAYKRFGEQELRDLEDGAKWLASQPGIDGSRMLLNGWSYGGFMTTYAMTHSTVWSAGIAGGTVADWRDYDSIYTERYMLVPDHNKEGYEASSPRFAAKNLHGRLLMLHGLIDDNVHVQNTIQFGYELQKANIPFQLMLYPKSRHGVTDLQLIAHMRTTMWEFVEASLLR
jgi:dipeptidyl-peptidase-4